MSTPTAIVSMPAHQDIGAARMWRRHAVLIVMVGLAATVRLLVIIAYQPAFFYSDSYGYLTTVLYPLRPDDARPFGYTFLLRALEPTGTFLSVVVVQHAVGLLLGVAIYLFLCHLSVPGWVAALAAAPVLFDSLQITLEHYLLTETLFTALLVAAVLVLLWSPKPGVPACVAAATALAGAWLTRPNALPVVLILAGYLVARRVGWRSVLAFGLTFAVFYLVVMAMIGDRPSAYGGSWMARTIYGRVAIFADCERIRLTEEQASVCPAEPVAERRSRSDWYIWHGVAAQLPPGDNAVLAEFAVAAITQQPGDYLRVVARELAPHFLPWQDLGPGHRCLLGRWTLAADLRDASPNDTHCHVDLAEQGFQARYADSSSAPPPTTLTRMLQAYSTYVRTPPPAVAGAYVLTIAALLARRRPGWPSARDAGLLVLIATALIVLPVMVGMYEIRYGLPALPFVCLAAALAWHRIGAGRGSERREGRREARG